MATTSTGQATPERLVRAADAAYGTYYPNTNPKFTGKQRAWRGNDPEKHPMLRPVKAALAELGYDELLAAAAEVVDAWGTEATQHLAPGPVARLRQALDGGVSR